MNKATIIKWYHISKCSVRRASFEKQNEPPCIEIVNEMRIILGKTSMKMYLRGNQR